MARNPASLVIDEILLPYLTKFPKLPTLTLAKKIYKENKTSFASLEDVRNRLRYRRGNHGDFSRTGGKRNTEFHRPSGSRNPYENYKFELPESHSESWEPFIISQSNILILSDLHFPYQNNKSIELALRYGLEKKVNCILINGDLIDFATISRHEKDWRHRSVSQEFDAVRAFLKTLRKAFPKARIIFKYGNHDERWEKWLFLKAPEIFDCTDFQLEVLLKLAELKIEVVKDKRPIKIGKLPVLHGHEMFGSGGVNPARATFLKVIDSMLVGHYHRTSQHTEQSSLSGMVYSVNSTGCLCGMTPQWMPMNKWNQGFAHVIHTIKTGEYSLNNLKIINGKIFQ